MNAALVCGEALSRRDERDLLVRAGLYHLIVVSGTHLVLLDRLLQIALPRRLRFLNPLFLGFFCLMSSWQAPVVRAWLQSCVRRKSESETAAALNAWLLCLALHPQWIHSLSLHLSAAAGLALIPRRRTRTGASLQVLAFLFPLLAGWAPLHPSVSIIAVFLAPPSLCLWAFAALTEVVNHPGWSVWNHLWIEWERVLFEVAAWQGPAWKMSLQNRQWGSFWVLLLWLGVHFFQIRERRPSEALPARKKEGRGFELAALVVLLLFTPTRLSSV